MDQQVINEIQYLEKVADVPAIKMNDSRRAHIAGRSQYIQREIRRLRQFANLKPNTKVAEQCNRDADALQRRLDYVRAKATPK